MAGIRTVREAVTESVTKAKAVISSALFLAALGLLTLLVSIPSQLRSGELIQGGGFEDGDFHSAWTHGAGSIYGGTNPTWADHDVVLDLPYTGNYSALLGFKYTPQRRNRMGFMYQDVAIPGNISGATLYFKFRQQGYDGLQYDPFRAYVMNTSGSVLETIVTYAFTEWNNQFKDSGWLDDDDTGPVGHDMTGYAGSTVRIYFRQDNLYDNFYETWTLIDDVSMIYRKFVDLAADGVGDDMFGVLGSGDGGYSTNSGEEGESCSYILEVENEGNDSDSYQLSVSLPTGWSAVINYGGTGYSFPWTTPTLPVGSSIEAEVVITIPQGEPVGGYFSILDAVSVAHGNRFDSVKLITNVVPSDHLTDLAIDSNGFGVIDPDGGGGISYRQAPPDTEVTFQIDLVNGGIDIDSFRVWFDATSPLTAVMEEGAITYSGMFTTGAIDAGDSKEYTLRVTIPAGIIGGDCSTMVYAASLSDTLRKDGVEAVSRVEAPRVDMIICGSGNDIIDDTGNGLGGSSTIAGLRGSTIYFPVVIQNEGGVVDSFALDWTSPGIGWKAVIDDGSTDHDFPWTTPAFQPFSEKSYTLAITIRGGASYDTYMSILAAVSQADGTVKESVTAAVTVISGNEVDVVIDGNGDDAYGPLGTGLGGSSVKTASPGDTLYFSLDVQNQGGENLFDCQWTTPSGWEVVIGDSTSIMRGVTAGNYIMEVRIPAECEGGMFDIIFDARKTNKQYLVDSVRGRIFVFPPHIVDALIDGDGDEVFGTPGSGDGGWSGQSTIGGRTVSFTIELQNQGGEGESYVVEWNSFAGWSAELDGSSSPCTTQVVGAGASILLPFQVIIPTSAPEGDYDYILDVTSNIDTTNTESVNAHLHINPPPRVDLVIQGEGALEIAPAGTGEGGRALLFGDGGIMVIASLQVVNRGGFPDSFQVSWSEPAGWPAGSVLLSDGTNDYSSPYITSVIDPDSSLTFTVKVQIPAGCQLRNSLIIDAVGLTRPLEDSVLLEIATGAWVRGRVYDDGNHNGFPDPGEEGWPGVKVMCSQTGGWISFLTGSDGDFVFEVSAGVAREMVEVTPSGMISISPDTVAVSAPSAGDTVMVYFADVGVPAIQPECDLSANAGGCVDIAHTVIAGTSGQATLTTTLPQGWVDVRYRDINGDGRLDGGDTRLTADDLDLDPDVPGSDVVPIIIRVFVPSQIPAGTTGSVSFLLEQTLSGTAIKAQASVSNRVTVLARASGLLKLVKEVDLGQARPGDVLTYTIVFDNPGVEDVWEIEIIDPVSESVELVTGAFGAGQDIEWIRDSTTVYLTADPTDPDEALFYVSERRLRIILSRQDPYILESGREGKIIYRVRIR
jgi:uncharacterized repeat protein (TIGR01451 family)